MKTSDCTKYLGLLISSTGGVYETIEDRRSRGWGKIATIMAILSEITLGSFRLGVGHMIMINSMLFSAKAWSGVTEKQLARLEVVDTRGPEIFFWLSAPFLKTKVAAKVRDPKI